MKLIKRIIIIFMCVFECYLCSEAYQEKSFNYYLETPMEMPSLTLEISKDATNQEKKDIIKELSHHQNIIVMGNDMFGNENKTSLYSDQTSWLKEITGSKKKYEEYVKNHKVTTYTGTRMEPQIYHFSDLRYQDLKDTKTLYVYVEKPEDVQTISDALMNYPVNINPQENHEKAET